MIKIITNYGSLAQEVFPDELRIQLRITQKIRGLFEFLSTVR